MYRPSPEVRKLYETQLLREGRPLWYKAMRKETAEARRMTRRKHRHACKKAVDLGEEPPRMRGTCGWISW